MSLRLIAGKFKGRVLHTPKTTTTRPTQGALRGSVFNICQGLIENAEFLDLFAGSGAMGFEALSRGASHVTLVETNKLALIAIKKNIELLNVSEVVTVLKMDAFDALDRLKRPFDLIYIDPPYDLNVKPLIEKVAPLLKPEGTLFIEERYIPNKQPPQCPLFLKSSRRFGSALLHEYQKKLES